jgi:hypothetical protein
MNQPPKSQMPVEFGNAEQLDTNRTGWMLGFSDWSKDGGHNLRHMPVSASSVGLCAKWFSHQAGDPNGQEKPLSTGRTMSILISEHSEFRIDFSADPSFPAEKTLTHVLRARGDFAIWGEGLYHRAFGLKAAIVMTLRWEPKQISE